MKQYVKSKLMTTLFIASCTLPAENAFALEEVTCHFSWEKNETYNLRSSSKYMDTAKTVYVPKGVIGGFLGYYGELYPEISNTKKVRNREYDRLIEAGRVDARVSNKPGPSCVLNHPENTRLDVWILKGELILNSRNPYEPDCDDLKAKVECFPAE